MCKRKLLLQIIFSFVLLSGCSNKPPTLAELTQLLEKNVEQGDGLSERVQKVSADIRKMGADVIPHLIILLKHENSEVRNLAAFTLKEMDGLNESHLDALIDANRNGVDWLTGTIAKIGTPKAFNYLAEELVKDKSTYSAYSHAFSLIGDKGVPYLIELLKRYHDKDLIRCVVYIFTEMKGRVESTIDPLIEIAKDKELDKNIRKDAILTIGKRCPKRKITLPELREFSSSDPEFFKKAVDDAIINMQLPEAVPILLDRMNENPKQILVYIYQLAALKESGKAAGPTLVRYLKHESWTVRFYSAHSLGFIGYTEAGPVLIDLLKTNYDWQLVIAAVDSLGRLKVRDAIPSLTYVKKNHWYYRVRDAAAKAILAITKNKSYESKNHFDGEEQDFVNEYRDVLEFDHNDKITWKTAEKWMARTYYDPEDQLSKETVKKLFCKAGIRLIDIDCDDSNIICEDTLVQNMESELV
jgi:HEAT repeat protein